jgi:myo-inositol-1(or 4)-monophosphatase
VTTPTALVKVMIDAARKAGRALARDFGEVAELQVSRKGAADYVSAADLKAEQTLFEELTRARPGYGFLGEERGLIEGSDKTHTWIDDKRLRVAARTRFEEAVFATGIPFMGHGQHARFLRELHQISQRVSGVRRFGSAALDMAWVAAGRFDGYWERDLHAWDLAAGMLMVTEAGGQVSDIDGRDDVLGTGSVCAANADLHPKLLERLKAAG